MLRVATLTDPVLRIAGAEFLILYYALVAPFVRRAPREDEFAYTKGSGLGGLLFGLGFMVATEGVTVHLFLHASNPLAAWVLAASDVYALLWLVAAYHAARLRPVALLGDRLLVRVSMLWTADLPRGAIASVESISDTPRDRRVLRAAFGAAPVLLVTLSRPVEALGPFCIRRIVDRIALYVDEPAKLRDALASWT